MNKVTKPKHYTQGRIECFDAIDAMVGGLNRLDDYRIVNTFGDASIRVTPLPILKKARRDLNRLIAELEK